ncbi:hypothetical protein [Ureibacillus sp. GCM10028918]|uniref:hypothetical protein n=1 Tax=Ureibacillus sp. GCM10028918 TaxID=3273429 RepID=UPI00361197B4
MKYKMKKGLLGVKKRTIRLLSVSILSIALLSACGDNNKETAKQIVGELQEKRYGLASDIYDESKKELSVEDKEALDKEISLAIIDYLETSYSEMESGNINKATFYNSLYKINQIGIENSDLLSTLDKYNKNDEEKTSTQVVNTVPQQVNNGQEQLKIAFENDLVEFNTLYGELVSVAKPVVKGLANDPTSVDEASIYAMIDKLEEFVAYMKMRPDFSSIEKYEQTNKYILEMAGSLITAYSFMSSNMESKNYDLVIEGIGKFTEAEEYLEKASEMYELESQK